MKILILEDDHSRISNFKKYLDEDELTICETAEDAISYLTAENEYDSIMLDHDLGGEHWVDSSNKNTGAEVARYMNNNYPFKQVQVIIHSMNPHGANYINDTLVTFPNTKLVPFSVLLKFWKTLA